MLGQHTPGPWEIDTHAKRDGRLFVQAERNGAYVALCDGISATIGSREELLANAHLIAAAPDMLQALTLAESALDTYRTVGAFAPGQPSGWLLRTIRAAIARATGTPTPQRTAAAVAVALGRSPTEPGTARLAADLGE